MKETKEKRRIFNSSKFIKSDYETDKKGVVAFYNTIGFRDARVLGDSIWRNEDGQLELQINIEEGNRYFFRDIAWKGNSIYDTKTLAGVLGIEKGVSPKQTVKVEIKYADGTAKTIETVCRIDTASEIEYYKNGGILQYVLRSML